MQPLWRAANVSLESEGSEKNRLVVLDNIAFKNSGEVFTCGTSGDKKFSIVDSLDGKALLWTVLSSSRSTAA